MATTTNFGWTTPDDTGLVKDGASAIRTLGSAIDTSMVKLKGGTTGQVLSKASNTDMDFSWAADAGIPATIVDAKGDIIAATGADAVARLAVGTNGQVLSADSTASTGLKWITPASSSNYTLLNAGGTSLSGTTTTISGISGMSKLLIFINGASTNSTGDNVYFRLNADTGTNYVNTQLKAELTTTYNTDYWDPQVSTAGTFVYIGAMSNQSSSAVSAQILIDGCNSSGAKVFQWTGGGTKAAGGTSTSGPTWRWGGGYYTGSSTISSVSIISGNTFDAGTVYIYGSAN